MDNEAKLRPILLERILKERTDEDNYLSTNQLCAILKSEYGIDTHRTTIKADIEMLQKAGVGVQAIRSSQNLYNYIDRDFDVAELKILIDAVESSKFITKEKSDLLVSKITALAGRHKAQELKRNLVVDGRIKNENEQGYLIVDAINTAINLKKKIRFQMSEYNIKKQRVLHNKGEYYTFSPYSLVWDGDYYYVVGFSDKYNSIGSHRVDRIYKQPEVLDDAAVVPPGSFNINQYINTMFRMYDCPREQVELICSNDIMDAIIDRFGANVTTYACDQNNFRVVCTVAVGKVFYNWIFGFGDKVKIKAPENVKNQYAELVQNALNNLNQN